MGVEQIAGDVASRCGVPLDEARRLLTQNAADSLRPQAPAEPPLAPTLVPVPESDVAALEFGAPMTPPSGPEVGVASSQPDGGFVPLQPDAEPAEVVATALSDGIRRIASEVRHSLDFYLTGQADNPVTRALLCGPALEIPGFAESLERELGIAVVRGEVALASPGAAGDVPPSILPVAAGLSVPEGPA